jgi:hypothetical protein
MSDMGFTPNLIASGTIKPFRFVKISGAFTGAVCTAITEQQIGVCDGSVYLFGQTSHAINGTPITLQPSNTVQITVGTTSVSAGGYLMPEGSGTGEAVTAAGATAVSNYIALEAGNAGEVIRAFRFGQRGPVFS